MGTAAQIPTPAPMSSMPVMNPVPTLSAPPVQFPAPIATPVSSVSTVSAPTPAPIVTHSVSTAPVVDQVKSVQSPSVDVLSLLMDVVAEKTGYPSDALDLSMA